MELTKIRNFIVTTPEDNDREVFISLLGFTKLGSQLSTLKALDGVLTPNGSYMDLPYEGIVYVGIGFDKGDYSDDELEAILVNL